MYVLMVESMKAAACCAQDLRTGGRPCFQLGLFLWILELASLWLVPVQGHAKWLLSGVPIEGAVKVGERISKKNLGLTDGLDFPPRWPFFAKDLGLPLLGFWMSAVRGVQEAGRYDRYRFFACLPCLENGW